MNSARSVAIAITSAWSQSTNVTGRGKRSRHTSGRFMPGRDPDLRAHRLDEHRHQVRREDDPQQQVAELRAGRHVRREVARVDVRDARDEGGAEERPEPAEPAPLARERLLRRLEDARLARQDVVERMDQGVPVVARAPARGSGLPDQEPGRPHRGDPRQVAADRPAGAEPAGGGARHVAADLDDDLQRRAGGEGEEERR